MHPYRYPPRLMPTHSCFDGDDGDKAVLDQLSELNEEYRQKNGFVFLVCASGLPADAILALLKARLPNDRDTEVNRRLRDIQ